MPSPAGTGEHALMAAGLGLDATRAGLAPSAVDTARHKARQRDRTTRFLRHDARNPADLGESFGAVLDRGHLPRLRGRRPATYTGNLRSAVAPPAAGTSCCAAATPSARRLGTGAP